jgi:hypothetical protein
MNRSNTLKRIRMQRFWLLLYAWPILLWSNKLIALQECQSHYGKRLFYQKIVSDAFKKNDTEIHNFEGDTVLMQLVAKIVLSESGKLAWQNGCQGIINYVV